MPVHVFLDTSVLPRNATGVSAEYLALAELAQQGEVSVYLSMIAYNEWITQRQKEFLDKVARYESATGDLIRDRWSPLLDRHQSLSDLKAWFEQHSAAVATMAHDSAAAVLDQLRPTLLTTTGDHAVSAFDGYFNGRPPYASVKARKDIPDAFILEALKDVPVPDGGHVHAAIHDTRLREAAASLPAVQVYTSLESLFELPEIVAAQANLRRAGAWQTWMERFGPELNALSPIIRNEIQRTAVDVLAYNTVHHQEIPDDNSEGTINGVDEPEDIEIDWDNVEEFAVGILSVPISFNVDVAIDFYVFRMDAYSVPDAVSVSFGDPEHDHFYEAEAQVSVHVNANAVFRIPDDSIDAQEIGDLEDLNLVEDVEIEVNEDDVHGIFR